MINQKSFRYGLILGGISLGINVLLYLLNPGMMVQGIIGMITFIVIIVLWILFATRVRRENNDSFTFGEAFVSLFIIGVVSMLIGIIWQLLLIQVIDPEMADRMLEMTIQMTEKFGGELTPQQIEDTKAQYTLSGQLVGSLWSIVVMAVISALVALIIKKKPSIGGPLDVI